jgi:hypothetical protein
VVVLGDGDQLIMAIHNLLENAINYSPNNTNVSISASIADDIIEIVVTQIKALEFQKANLIESSNASIALIRLAHAKPVVQDLVYLL